MDELNKKKAAKRPPRTSIKTGSINVHARSVSFGKGSFKACKPLSRHCKAGNTNECRAK